LQKLRPFAFPPEPRIPAVAIMHHSMDIATTLSVMEIAP
jgi:hypothetical protein